MQGSSQKKPKRNGNRKKKAVGECKGENHVPRLVHEIYGEGVKTIIFVHSFLSHKGFWRMQVPFFTPKYRCITCDLPGISQALDNVKEGPSIKLLARGIVDLIEEYCLTDVVLVGHSFGNRVVMEADSMVKDRVSGVVLIDGDYSSTGNHATDKAILDAKMKAAGSFQDMILPFFMGMHFDQHHEDLQADLLESLLTFKRPEHVQLYTNMVTWDADFFFRRLRETITPILVLQSTMRTKEGQWKSLMFDEESPYQELIKTYAKFCKSLTVVGGHFPMLENPLGINCAISDFLECLTVSDGEIDRDLQEFLTSLGDTDTLEVDENVLMDGNFTPGLPYT